MPYLHSNDLGVLNKASLLDYTDIASEVTGTTIITLPTKDDNVTPLYLKIKLTISVNIDDNVYINTFFIDWYDLSPSADEYRYFVNGGYANGLYNHFCQIKAKRNRILLNSLFINGTEYKASAKIWCVYA